MQSNFHRIISSTNTPAYVFFELTRRCNLNCRHCYVRPERRTELEYDEITGILKQLAAGNALVVNFSGGEPFVREDIFKIMTATVKSGLAVKIFTNGTMIDRAEAEALKRINPVFVEVSVHSSLETSHDSITGVNGSWSKACKAVKILKARGVRVRVKCSILKSNFKELESIESLFKSWGVQYQFNPFLMPAYGDPKVADDNAIGEKELKKFFDGRTEADRAEGDLNFMLSSNLCSAGITSCSITAYGDIQPCVAFPKRLGSLRKMTFNKIWRENKFLKDLRMTRKRDISKCAGCRLLPWCSKCPGIAYALKGDYRSVYEQACITAGIRALSRKNIKKDS